MNPFNSFDPIANPTGIIRTNGINKGEQIVLYNSSLACLQITFLDKTKDTLPPCWVRSWSKEGHIGDLQYQTLFTLPLAGQPVSLLYGTVYEPGEHIAEINGPLQYVYNTNLTNTPFLTNTGFVAGTPVISMTPVLDDPGSAAVVVRNNGNMSLGDTQNDALLKVTGRNSDSIQITNDFLTVYNNLGTPLMAISAAGFSVLSPSTGFTQAQLGSGGTFQIFDAAGNVRIKMDTSGNLIFTNAAGAMIGEFRGDGILFCDDHIPLSGDNLQLHDQSGAVQLKITTAGVTVSNALTLPLGSLTRVKSFTAAVTTVSTFFNHNLGVVPDIVILQVQGGVNTARSVMYDPATMTTTQVALIATGSFNVIGLAIKF